MKKTVLTMIIIAFAILSASAQEFRGFVDVFAGRCLFKSSQVITFQDHNVRDIRDNLTFGAYITGGYQFTPQWFAGIGFGGYTDMLGFKSKDYYTGNDFESIYLPVYADVRWTLNLERKITPYVDLKIGYQFGVDLEMQESWYPTCDYDNYSYYDYGMIGYKGTMLLQPGVGVRFGKKSGFNLGLAYNAMIGKKLYGYSMKDSVVSTMEWSITTGTLMLTFGADF